MTVDQVMAYLQNVLYGIYQNIYVSLGGSLEKEASSWQAKAQTLLTVGLRTLIILVLIWFGYLALLYALKRLKGRLNLSDVQMGKLRTAIHYVFPVIGVIGVMTQIGVKPSVVQATLKATLWTIFYGILWAKSGQILAKVLRYYHLNASIEQLLKNLILVTIIFLALTSILAQFGFDIISLLAGLGVVGLVVGFAAQSTLANFIAGVTILVEQFFQVGDWVRIGVKEGRVVKISLRATQILDRDNMIIIIPNATMSSSEIVNLTSKKMIRFAVRARIPLHADMTLARQSILKMLAKEEVVLKHPAPMATVSDIGDYALQVIVRFWVAPLAVAQIPIIKENITERVKRCLDDAGIVVPYPHTQILLEHDRLPQGEKIDSEKLDDDKPYEDLPSEESVEQAMRKV